MKRFSLPILLSFLLFTNAFGQDRNKVQQESLWKIGGLIPNLVYEAKISSNTTLELDTGLGLIFGYGGNREGWIFEYFLYLEASPRYYYNFDSRLEDGKNISNYSGNYISFVARANLYSILSSKEEPNDYIFGPVWGLQRRLSQNWYFNFEIGPGILLSKEETSFVPIIGLSIGIYL